MFSPILLGMRKNMFLPLKTTRKRGQHCKDRSLVVMQLFAMSTGCLWADTDAFVLLAGWTHEHCQPLSGQKTSPCMHPDTAYLPVSVCRSLWLTVFDRLSLTLTLFVFLSLLILLFPFPVFRPPTPTPRAFVWLYFRHQTWRFVTVDTIRSDLQCAPSLWTFAVLLLG